MSTPGQNLCPTCFPCYSYRSMTWNYCQLNFVLYLYSYSKYMTVHWIRIEKWIKSKVRDVIKNHGKLWIREYSVDLLLLRFIGRTNSIQHGLRSQNKVRCHDIFYSINFFGLIIYASMNFIRPVQIVFTSVSKFHFLTLFVTLPRISKFEVIPFWNLELYSTFMSLILLVSS